MVAEMYTYFKYENLLHFRMESLWFLQVSFVKVSKL